VERSDWRFAVTSFADVRARAKRETSLTAPELCELVASRSAPTKKQLPLLKLAIFGGTPTADGSLRHDANVRFLTGVVADYDGERITLEAAADMLYDAMVEAIVYSSPSATPSSPRWRVVAPLLAPMVLPERIHGRMMDRLNGVLKGCLAPESWTLSQAHYYGKALDNLDPDFRVIHIVGQPIEELHELQETAIGKPGTRSEFAGGRRGSGGPGTADHWRALLGDVEKGRHDGRPARNAALASIAGALLQDGIEGEQYRTLLRQYNDRHCKPPLPQRDVAQIARSVARTHSRRSSR
jgi:hypothetical protein